MVGCLEVEDEACAWTFVGASLLTSIAAFIASGEMAVAYFQTHAPKGWNPLANGGELAVLFCFIFLYIAARGGGRWSADRR